MGQVSVTLNGRTYRLSCADGEEDRLLEVATYVKERVEKLCDEFGQVGDDRLLLMAAVVIGDELWDARRRIEDIEELATRPDEPRQKRSGRSAA
ncbi:MAG: cell division protein ZapA [Hyphomicrobiaceae bacterium]|jgi:cell division protein ZapA